MLVNSSGFQNPYSAKNKQSFKGNKIQNTYYSQFSKKDLQDIADSLRKILKKQDWREDLKARLELVEKELDNR